MWVTQGSCLTPEVLLPVVQPAELWEQRFAASALLWEQSPWLGPKLSERRRYSNRHLLPVCNTGELGIPFQTLKESLSPTSVALVPLSTPVVSILPMQSAPDTPRNPILQTWEKLDPHFLTWIIVSPREEITTAQHEVQSQVNEEPLLTHSHPPPIAKFLLLGLLF